MAEPVLDYSVSPLCLEYHICGMAEEWEETSVAVIHCVSPSELISKCHH